MMHNAGAAAAIVLMDACRSNAPPYGAATRGVLGRARGMRVTAAGPNDETLSGGAASGTVIAWACSDGQVAFDGRGKNGMFTKHLLRHMAAGNTLATLLSRVREGVATESSDSQVPCISLEGGAMKMLLAPNNSKRFSPSGGGGGGSNPAKPHPSDGLRDVLARAAGGAALLLGAVLAIKATGALASRLARSSDGDDDYDAIHLRAVSKELRRLEVSGKRQADADAKMAVVTARLKHQALERAALENAAADARRLKDEADAAALQDRRRADVRLAEKRVRAEQAASAEEAERRAVLQRLAAEEERRRQIADDEAARQLAMQEAAFRQADEERRALEAAARQKLERQRAASAALRDAERARDFPSITRIMDAHVHLPAVQRQGCGATFAAVSSAGGGMHAAKGDAGAAGLAEATVRAMAAHMEDASVQDHCVRTVAIMSASRKDNTARVLRAGGARTIVAAARAHAHDGEVQQNAVDAVNAMARMDPGVASAPGTVELVSEALRVHGHSAALVSAGCLALSALTGAEQRGAAQRAGAAGGVSAAADALAAFPGHADVQEACCYALIKATHAGMLSANAAATVRAGGLESAAATLAHHRGGAQRAAALLVGNLVQNNAALCERAADCGALSAAVTAARAAPADETVQEAMLYAAASITAGGTPSLRKRARAAGAPRAAWAAVARFPIGRVAAQANAVLHLLGEK
jgi:hypothetical protein